MFSKIILLSLVCLVVVYGYSNCGPPETELVNVEVSNCAPNTKCILKRETNSTITITFKTKEDQDELKADVCGDLGLNLCIPFPLPNEDACLDSGITCPIKAGTQYKYHASLEIKKVYPKVKVLVNWQLKRGNDTIVCAKIPAQIQ